MQRISTATRWQDKFGAGKDGFRDGDPGLGTASTQLEALWFDNAQEEIANAIELSGLALDPNDMTQLFQAIGRAVGGPYVMRGGDTMTGPLDNSSGRLISSGLLPSVTVHIPGAIAAGIWAGAVEGLVLGQLDGNGVPTSAWASLLGGNLTVNGNIAGNNVTAAAAVFANAGITPAFATTPDYVLNADATYNNLYFSSVGGYYWRYQRATGLLEWVANNAVRFNIDLTGNTNITGNLNVANVTAAGDIVGANLSALATVFGTAAQITGAIGADTVTTNGRVLAGADVVSMGPIFVSFAAAQDFIISEANGSRGITFQASSAMNWNPGNNIQWLWAGAQSSMILDMPLGNLNIFGVLAQSDERVKKDVQPFTRGLSDVIRLNPQSFKYNGRGGSLDNDHVYYGLTAQEIEPIMPECVEPSPIVPNSSGERTTLDNQLSVNTMPLTIAYINAFKEIAARLDALEATPIGRTSR